MDWYYEMCRFCTSVNALRHIKCYGIVLWNVVFLHIGKCTDADINSYGLVLLYVAFLQINKCIEADINRYGFVIWIVSFLHISKFAEQI
jgi:hypothetical protein